MKIANDTPDVLELRLPNGCVLRVPPGATSEPLDGTPGVTAVAAAADTPPPAGVAVRCAGAEPAALPLPAARGASGTWMAQGGAWVAQPGADDPIEPPNPRRVWRVAPISFVANHGWIPEARNWFPTRDATLEAIAARYPGPNPADHQVRPVEQDAPAAGSPDEAAAVAAGALPAADRLLPRARAAALIDTLRTLLAARTAPETIEQYLARQFGLPPLAACPGEAHRTPHSDSCGACAPRWGWIGPRVGIR